MAYMQPVTHCLETQLTDITLDRAIALFERQAIEMGFERQMAEPEARRFATPYGILDLHAANDQPRLALSAASAHALYQFKEAAEHLLDHEFGAGKVAVRWVGDLAYLLPPPNFCEATILDSRPADGPYQRVTVTGEGIERFFSGSLHFRLLMPKHQKSRPVWPHLDANGKTIWPAGTDELRKPIYTVRTYDAAAVSFTFDVFLHDGGPTADWAKAVQPGEKVGLMGPAGGWIPEGDFLLLAGDETAIPAICRILQEGQTTQKGQVILSIDGAADGLSIPRPPGMELQWINRQTDGPDALLEAAKAVILPQDQSSFVWLAADKATARKARQYFRNHLGYHGKNSYLAAYWGD